MKKYIKIFIIMTFISLVGANNNQILNEEQQNELMSQVMQVIWEQAMIAKEATHSVMPQIREELLENLCSSSPRTYFETHADLSDSLAQSENTSASIYVSDDNQNTWIQNDIVAPINQPGYENTWGATTQISDSDNVDWYLQGSVDSGSLGLDFGQVTVSQSPFNESNAWPPSNNLYATIATDDTGEAGSGQDIVNLKATYSDDKLFTSLGLNGSCCNEGSLFGPWNLYTIAVVNPDAVENGVAYAYAYGDGGFGQLYPGIYKITGDFSSGVGEVGGFEVLSENFNYSTAGNQLQASSFLSIITDDPDWGDWPNSFNGVGLVGVTLEAGLDGLDVAIELLDTSDVGVFIMSTQSQTGNIAPVLSNPTYENGVLQVTYSDADNNLPTTHEVFIEGDMVFNMVPLEHSYAEGVIFQLADINTSGTVSFIFSDGGDEFVTLDFDISGGSGSCQLTGDANNDGQLNVLDVVLTVNLILSGLDNYEECSDVNSDNELNILDIVTLITLILG